MLVLRFIVLGTVVAGPVWFGLLCIFFRKTPTSTASNGRWHAYDIYSRQSRYTAIRRDVVMNYRIGLMVAALPVLSIPILYWRYRHRRALWLGISPLVAMLLALLIAEISGISDHRVPPMLSIVAGVCGLLAARNDTAWQVARLVGGGWKRVGARADVSRRRAVRAFKRAAREQMAITVSVNTDDD